MQSPYSVQGHDTMPAVAGYIGWRLKPEILAQGGLNERLWLLLITGPYPSTSGAVTFDLTFLCLCTRSKVNKCIFA